MSYHSWLNPDSCPDPKGGVDLRFTFVLPENEGVEFLQALKGNYDLIEDAFQNVYPGFTGENGAKRMKVEKLTVVLPYQGEYKGGSRYEWERAIDSIKSETSFSHPVGETPWIGLHGEKRAK